MISSNIHLKMKQMHLTIAHTKKLQTPSIRDWMDPIVDPNDTTQSKIDSQIYKRTLTKPRNKSYSKKRICRKI